MVSQSFTKQRLQLTFARPQGAFSIHQVAQCCAAVVAQFQAMHAVRIRSVFRMHVVRPEPGSWHRTYVTMLYAMKERISVTFCLTFFGRGPRSRGHHAGAKHFGHELFH